MQYPKHYEVDAGVRLTFDTLTDRGYNAAVVSEAIDGLDADLWMHVFGPAVDRAAEVIGLAPYPEEQNPLFVIRFWDGFDGEWMDVSGPLVRWEANRLCGDKNEKRSGSGAGKRTGSYGDIDYYAVFPADTTMYFAEGRSQTHAPSDAYDLDDPKHPEYHSTHSDIWDMREGK